MDPKPASALPLSKTRLPPGARGISVCAGRRLLSTDPFGGPGDQRRPPIETGHTRCRLSVHFVTNSQQNRLRLAADVAREWIPAPSPDVKGQAAPARLSWGRSAGAALPLRAISGLREVG